MKEQEPSEEPDARTLEKLRRLGKQMAKSRQPRSRLKERERRRRQIERGELRTENGLIANHTERDDA